MEYTPQLGLLLGLPMFPKPLQKAVQDINVLGG